MATLTVLKFNNSTGAQEALAKLMELQKQRLITIQDAATVSWPEGKKKPKTRQAVPTGTIGALDGAFWGMLFGLLFFVPFFGMAVGAVIGGLSGKMADYGINDQFIKDVRDKVTEGTSALFLLSSGAVRERLAEEFQGTEFELIASNLTQEQEAELMAAFGQENEA
jgi:uncharacterized membrane protein